MGPDELTRLVGTLRADPARAVLLFDFDGTLAPVVDEPAAAAAPAPVLERLERLARSYRAVGIVSGRPLAFLADRLPPGLALSGLYGLETSLGGVVAEHPEAPAWRDAVARAVAAASVAAGPDGPLQGLVVESKGISLTLHWRTAPALEADATAFGEELAARVGLHARPAKRSIELHPPVAIDKGTAVRSLADGAEAVLYVGDDVGDLPALAALAELAAGGAATLGLVVGSSELPDALRAAADAVLPTQASVLELLDALLPEP